MTLRVLGKLMCRLFLARKYCRLNTLDIHPMPSPRDEIMPKTGNTPAAVHMVKNSITQELVGSVRPRTLCMLTILLEPLPWECTMQLRHQLASKSTQLTIRSCSMFLPFYNYIFLDFIYSFLLTFCIFWMEIVFDVLKKFFLPRIMYSFEYRYSSFITKQSLQIVALYNLIRLFNWTLCV